MAENTGGVSYKEGIVAEARPGFARVRFPDIDNLVSAWLPLVVRKSLKDKECLTLDAGEHVACVMDKYFESGCVLGAIYSDADTPPVDSADKLHFRFFDGGTFEYDRASGMLTIVAKGRVNVTAPEINCNGNVTVNGNLQVNGDINASGSIMDAGGNSNHHSH